MPVRRLCTAQRTAFFSFSLCDPLFYTSAMRPLTARVLKCLADAEFHSGEAIADALGMSRGSVWHAIRDLEALGLDVYKVPGRGYRLSRPVSVLEAAQVEHHLGALASRVTLELCTGVDSTSTRLLERTAQGADTGTVVAAEWQSGGRGRLGRAWYAAIGGGVLFSLLWRFGRGAGALSGLSLATGVAVARGVEALGASGIALKWPNDVLWGGRKLAGILIELQGDALGPTAAVIGIGVNVRLSVADHDRIGQPATDLGAVCGAAPDRNLVLARLLTELHRALDTFAENGFAPLRAEWQRRHAHQDRRVTLLLPGGVRASGYARGVGEDGSLLLETRAGIKRYHSGEISVRSASAGKSTPIEAADERR
jgi:BirA family transcriptional regulator, biotin operon repressor / biotin---[acetyl-CoA-carboxylase] ligase